MGGQRAARGGDTPVDRRDDDEIVDSQIVERSDLGDFSWRCTENDRRPAFHKPERALKTRWARADS